jgi:hypothetical protein
MHSNFGKKQTIILQQIQNSQNVTTSKFYLEYGELCVLFVALVCIGNRCRILLSVQKQCPMWLVIKTQKYIQPLSYTISKDLEILWMTYDSNFGKKQTIILQQIQNSQNVTTSKFYLEYGENISYFAELIYVICVCLLIMMSNTYYVVFLFCLCTICCQLYGLRLGLYHFHWPVPWPLDSLYILILPSISVTMI